MLIHGLNHHYLYQVWRHHKRVCTEESYKNYKGYPIEPEWICSPKEFIGYIEGTLGVRPSESHILAFYDRSLGLVRGNLLWKLKFDVEREANPSTGLYESPTYRSFKNIKRFGVVKRWEKFENFLEDAGIRGENMHVYRSNPNKPFGPDNFEWIYFEGKKKEHPDYPRWKWAKCQAGMCDIWNDFRVFIQDMGDCPEGGMLKRRDLSRPHSPSNSFWSTEGVRENYKKKKKVLELTCGV